MYLPVIFNGGGCGGGGSGGGDGGVDRISCFDMSIANCNFYGVVEKLYRQYGYVLFFSLSSRKIDVKRKENY